MTTKTKKRKRQIKYLIAATMASAVEFIAFSLLILAGDSDLFLIFAQVISYILGFLAAFLLYSAWVFKGDKHHSGRKQFVMYGVVALFNMLASTVILMVLVNQFGVWAWLAKIMVIGLVVLWSFSVLQKIVFRKRKPARKSKR